MTTPITFYYGSGSPYAWKVWLALEHKALPYEAKRMQFDNDDLKTDAFKAINPRGQVPALVDAGFAMYESGAMLEYLEDRYPSSGAALWPTDVQSCAVARRRTAEIMSHIDPLNHELYGLVFGATPPQAETVATWKAKMAAELNMVETWLTQDYIGGATLGAADFTLYPFVAILGRVDVRKPGHDMLALLPPKLKAWKARIEALSYFDKTLPPHWRG